MPVMALSSPCSVRIVVPCSIRKGAGVLHRGVRLIYGAIDCIKVNLEALCGWEAGTWMDVYPIGPTGRSSSGAAL
jgi:hypothetical protein